MCFGMENMWNFVDNDWIIQFFSTGALGVRSGHHAARSGRRGDTGAAGGVGGSPVPRCQHGCQCRGIRRQPGTDSRGTQVLALGRFKWNFRQVILNLILVIDEWGIFCEIALRRLSLDLTDKLTLVQVMAWSCQATGHYPSQCWPSSKTPYGVTTLQWVNPCHREII